MDLKQLDSILKLAKKHKLKSLTVEGISFEFRDPSKRQSLRAVTQGEVQLLGENMPSDEDMLYYSSEPAIQTQP